MSTDMDSFEMCDKGYWLGDTSLFGLKWHVECIELLSDKGSPIRTHEGSPRARNGAFQKRIDNWRTANDGCMPQLGVAPNGKPAFYHMEVHAK